MEALSLLKTYQAVTTGTKSNKRHVTAPANFGSCSKWFGSALFYHLDFPITLYIFWSIFSSYHIYISMHSLSFSLRFPFFLSFSFYFEFLLPFFLFHLFKKKLLCFSISCFSLSLSVLLSFSVFPVQFFILIFLIPF